MPRDILNLNVSNTTMMGTKTNIPKANFHEYMKEMHIAVAKVPMVCIIKAGLAPVICWKIKMSNYNVIITANRVQI